MQVVSGTVHIAHAMPSKKKQVRRLFREAVFKRDGHQCTLCTTTTNLDAHHITDRNEMPDGGYVKENGITLCGEHHILAEEFHSTGIAAEGFSPEELYKKIGGSKELAQRVSNNES